MDELGPRIFAAYGLSPLRILRPQKGYRNTSLAAELSDGTWVNAIIYKSEPGILDTIQRSNRIGNILHDQGLPARRQVDPRIAVLSNHDKSVKRYACLYDYLPGETIPWEAYTMDHIKEVGRMHSAIHDRLKDISPDNIQEMYKICIGHFEQMARYFSDPGVKSAMRRKLGVSPPIYACTNSLEFLLLCAKLPNQQVLHMDFVRGNVLFKGTKISGILDFEKAAYGHPSFDIARTLAFLLVDCKYKESEKVRKYYLISGYAKRGPAPLRKVILPGKIDLLERLLDVFLLYDFYKFLRHNPYGSLAMNEHYTRTAALLQERGLIHPVNQMVK